jgi:hypothetical protein
MQLIKNQGGTAAAKRLEKAADLVPNLENQFQPKALKSAFTGDNASAVMAMKSGDFEKYAVPLGTEHKSSLKTPYNLGVFTKPEDLHTVPRGSYEEYLEYLSQYAKPGGGGFSSVPFLNLGQLKGRSFPNIQGHEGRHRTAALEKLGDKSTLVQMIPTPNLREPFPRRSQEEYLEALKEKIGPRPFVMPEQTEEGISRGLIELPEMFAQGGSVFNPEGSGYDYQTALAHGMGPTGTGEDAGHFGSVAPTSDDERMLRDLPRDAYVMLKGKTHETFDKAEKAEKERGSKIVKRGNRYYSVPK